MSLLRRVLLVLAAPVLALVSAGIITTLILVFTGGNIGKFWVSLLSWPSDRLLVNLINSAAILYISGVAAAIGFRMNLFNIGVEGQYRVGAFAAAYVAGQAWLPGAANTILAILVAMVAGAIWAAIAGLLRVTRGVSEVIATIMLNAIAGAFVGFLLNKVGVVTGVSRATKEVPESSWVPGFDVFGNGREVYGLSLLAIVVGVVFWVVLNRTRFGFNLRATGGSETAAIASGVDVKRMVVISMVMSGAVAGLIGMPVLFGQAHNYGTSFTTGIGFAGIAVALLGRNNPVGIAFGALIFAYLSVQAPALPILARVSPDIVTVTQGVIVLAVVVAYELVRRYRVRAEQAAVAREDLDTTPQGVAA